MSTQKQHRNTNAALTLLTSLFFMWGLITSLNDILIPHLKAVFTLSYVQAMLIQFSFFAAYFVMSWPAGALVRRLGYQRGIMIGLAGAGLGCLLFYPAAALRAYPFFLLALFILASGITLLQVAANPYVAFLGEPDSAPARLNLTQAFNSLGTTLGPLFGSLLILSVAVKSASEQAALTPAARAAYTAGEAGSVQHPYLLLAALLFVIALIIGLYKLPAVENEGEDHAGAGKGGEGRLWRHRHLLLGAIGIFAYVGAEVSTGSFLVNLMTEPGIAGFSIEAAGQHLALYWSGAMVGRFIGSALLRKVKPGALLASNALANAVLIALAMAAGGPVAMWALLAVGLFNSIMFPTIFSLALVGLGRLTSAGSGLLCMAIVGGAVVPLLQAFFADRIGLLHSFLVPCLCYLFIAWYGAKGHKPQRGGGALPLGTVRMRIH
jgi:FHS family L-fucose permease-like MFS transporter